MKFAQEFFNNQKGQVLIPILAIIVIVTLLIAAMVVVSNRGIQQSASFRTELSLTNVAEAGVENAKALFNSTFSVVTGSSPDNIGPNNSCCAGAVVPGGGGGGTLGSDLLSGDAGVVWAKYPDTSANTLDTLYNAQFGTTLPTNAYDASSPAVRNGIVTTLANNVNPNIYTLVVAQTLGNNQIRVRSFVFDPVTNNRQGMEAIYSGSTTLPVGAVAQLGMDGNRNITLDRTNGAFKNNIAINDSNSTVNLGPVDGVTNRPMPLIMGGELFTGNGSGSTPSPNTGITDSNFTSSPIHFKVKDAAGTTTSAMTAANVGGIDYPYSVFKGRQSMICSSSTDTNTGRIRNDVFNTLQYLQSQLFSMFPYDKLKIIALKDPERMTWIVNNVLTFENDSKNRAVKTVILSNDPAVNFGLAGGYPINNGGDTGATMSALITSLHGVGFTNDTELSTVGITPTASLTAVVIRRWEGKDFPFDVLFHGGYGFFAAHNTDPLIGNTNYTTNYQDATGANRTCTVLRQRVVPGDPTHSIDRNTVGALGVPLAGIVYVDQLPVDKEHDPHGNFWWVKNPTLLTPPVSGSPVSLFSTNTDDLLYDNGIDIKQAQFGEFGSWSHHEANVRGTLMFVFNEIGFARLIREEHGNVATYSISTIDEVSGRNNSTISMTQAALNSVIALDDNAMAHGNLNKFGQRLGYKYTRPPYYTAGGVVNTQAINAWNALTYSVDGTKTVWYNSRLNVNRYIQPPGCGTCPPSGTSSGFGFNPQRTYQPQDSANRYQSLQLDEYPYNSSSPFISYDMDGDGILHTDQSVADPNNTTSLANLVSTLVATKDWFTISTDGPTAPPRYEGVVPADIGTLPAVLYNTGIIDIHGVLNWSGLVYTPSRLELGAHANPSNDPTQTIAGTDYGQVYFGSIVSGAGASIGYSQPEQGYYIEFDPNSLVGLKLNIYTGLTRQSWKEIPGL